MADTVINYNLLKKRLLGVEKLYCQQLLHSGTVNTCEETVSDQELLPGLKRLKRLKLIQLETSCIS